MKLYVNGTTLTVNAAVAKRNTVTGVITLVIKVPYTEMEMSEIKTLFKTNTEDMIKTSDDGTEETFTGEFAYSNIVDDDINEVYTATLTAGENDFQLGRNRQLEKDNASLNATVIAKNSEIATLNTVLVKKENEIAEKAATIEVKEGTIAEQTETITTLEAEIEELKNNVGTEIDLSEFATALVEGVNDYE